MSKVKELLSSLPHNSSLNEAAAAIDIKSTKHITATRYNLGKGNGVGIQLSQFKVVRETDKKTLDSYIKVPLIELDPLIKLLLKLRKIPNKI